MVDWKTLYEKWDQVPEELRKKIFETFKKKTTAQLKFLFLRDTYAKLIWMKIPEAERFPPAKPKKVPVEYQGKTIYVDAGIKDILQQLWKCGLHTTYSCSGLKEDHPTNSSFYPYIQFEEHTSALKTAIERAGWLPFQYKDEVSFRGFAKLEGKLTDEEIKQAWAKLVKEICSEFVKPLTEKVKLRFLKDMPAIVGADFKVYGPFAKGDVVELPKVNADVIVKQEIGTYVITPPELPAKEIDALRTVVKVKADDLGLAWSDEVWSRFWKEYEARARELWSTKHVTYVEEEVENVLRAVGMPITPPAVRRERVRRPPTVGVPVEAPAEVFVTPVTIPKLPMSKLPFPRAPSTEEQAVLWDAFRYEMARLGQDPFRWRDNFKMHVLNRPYPDWATVLKNFNEFIDAIRTEKPFRLLPLVTLPMPWSEEEEQRKHDAILHFIATKLYPSMDELIHALYTFGVEVTEDDVKKAVKKGYSEKNIWLTSVPKEILESLIAQKIE